MSNYDNYTPLHPSYLDDTSSMLFMHPKVGGDVFRSVRPGAHPTQPDSFPLGGVKDAQQSPPPSDLGEMLNFDAVSPVVLSVPSPGYEVQFFYDDYPSHPVQHALSLPPINVDLATPYMIPHGPPSSVASTPATPGLVSPSHTTYASSPNLPALTPPTPLRNVPEFFPPSYPSPGPASASPYLGQVAPWQLSHSHPQPSPEPERVIPFSEHRRGPMVPQKRYKPHTSSDRRRYVDEVNLESSIHFYMQKPDEEGIPLKDAMHGRFARLAIRDEPMFQERGPSISVRINWPGYQPWSRQIPTRDFRNPPGPITRAKLAKNVAKSVSRFIAEHKGRPMEEDGDPAWAVGPGAIDVFDLVLVRLDHVSKGSWQAQLQLLRPFT
ncbi:hypothetical protein BC827DRAFT_580770 [Russula dissimulans]|nr:hypothetical protein BC827DRAFT_580770 [Russula dissimulans]